ncbi:ATP-binding protein [Geodermatophilus ruber]|uniref:ATP-binding protein n=1 Tax=Geodermatophilus ruber TaxID=504800 RepID=UPI001FE0014A|nr:ATP-binding protein [Geodermatophilus ruber]
MTETVWARRALPAPWPGARVLGLWQPATPADVTAHRRQLSAALHDGARPPGAAEDAIEALALVFEELTSNAVRHGRAPVCVEVTAVPGGWLIDVSDAATDRPPTPAIGRDPAHGGLGLHLTAALCADHGWTVVGDRKHVWAALGNAGSRPPVAAIPVRRFAAANRTAVPDRSRWRASWSAGEPTSGVAQAEA